MARFNQFLVGDRLSSGVSPAIGTFQLTEIETIFIIEVHCQLLGPPPSVPAGSSSAPSRKGVDLAPTRIHAEPGGCKRAPAVRAASTRHRISSAGADCPNLRPRRGFHRLVDAPYGRRLDALAPIESQAHGVDRLPACPHLGLAKQCVPERPKLLSHTLELRKACAAPFS